MYQFITCLIWRLRAYLSQGDYHIADMTPEERFYHLTSFQLRYKNDCYGLDNNEEKR